MTMQPIWKRIIALVGYPAYLSVAIPCNNECRRLGMPDQFKVEILSDLKKIIVGEF